MRICFNAKIADGAVVYAWREFAPMRSRDEQLFIVAEAGGVVAIFLLYGAVLFFWQRRRNPYLG